MISRNDIDLKLNSFFFTQIFDRKIAAVWAAD